MQATGVVEYFGLLAAGKRAVATANASFIAEAAGFAGGIPPD